ncbi:MAG: hypothetical protein H0V89_12735 [Deltaproteobacteria bacterium]|nr:hypothetical protein [Deltaproteobacteria bacterium]
MIAAWMTDPALAGTNVVDVSWSPVARARQDMLMSSLVHRGVAATGGAAAWRWHGARSALFIGLEVDRVPARSGPPLAPPSSWVTTRIPIGWGVDLVDGDGVDVVVGGLLDNRIELLSWSYAVTWTTGYCGAFLLGPWVDARWRPHDRWTLEGGATAAAFGWVARSPYALNDDEYIRANQTHNPVGAFGAYFADGRVVSVADHQAVRTRVAAVFELTETTGLLFAWRAEVWHDRYPLPVLAVGHALDLGTRVSW